MVCLCGSEVLARGPVYVSPVDGKVFADMHAFIPAVPFRPVEEEACMSDERYTDVEPARREIGGVTHEIG